ncbi:MAG TPA: choice-of-anchor Q domain-containing protein [Tahibacter sp.]|nr:choice-of-anchor Q domain-containing protein [Tahibacter sp.]
MSRLDANGTAWAARLLGLALLAVGASAQAATCRVATNGTAGNNGSTWAQAKNLISALASPSCSEIWVAEGVYKPAIGTDRAATFAVRSGVAVYGGFGGNENNRDERDPAVHRSVLSGDIGGDDVVDAHGITLSATDIVGDNSYHVVVLDGSVTTNTVLDGFILSGGLANDGNSAIGSAGGGLICHGDSAGQNCSPTLRRLVFRGNAAGIGGGMACVGLNQGACSATLEAVTFAGNTAQFGGGMASAGMEGGHCTPVLQNTTFSGNTTSFGGAAFANVTATDGGSSSAVLRNVTLSGNLGAEEVEGGGAIFNWKSNDTAGTATVLVVNAIAWDNGPNAIAGDPMTLQHSILQGGCPAGSVCSDLIAGDPKLGALQDAGNATPVRLPGMDTAALDAGTCTDAPATDQRGIARPQGASCDVGATEMRQSRLVVHVTGAGDVDAVASPALLGAPIVDCAQSSGACSAWYRAEPDASAIALMLHPAAGNTLQTVNGCGGSRLGIMFTTAALEAGCTVEVVFAPAAHTIGGTVTGLAGSGLVLLLSGTEALPIAGNGTFAFQTTRTSGNLYAVTIGTQPSQPSQACVVVNGNGTVGTGDVTNVVVHCGAATTYSVGGTLSGLATGATITLAINGGNPLPLSANGTYAFAPYFASGDSYAVTVTAQPAGQHCTLAHAEGTLVATNVNNVDVTCAAGGAQLQLGVTDDGDYARYGQVRDYLVTLANTGNDTARNVTVGADLDSDFDAANVHWICVGGAPGTACNATGGTGGFADTATLPPGTSLVWIVRAPIRTDNDSGTATFVVHATGASNAADSNTLVIFRDGVDVPYADGAGVVDPVRRAAADEAGDGTAIDAAPPAFPDHPE